MDATATAQQNRMILPRNHPFWVVVALSILDYLFTLYGAIYAPGFYEMNPAAFGTWEAGRYLVPLLVKIGTLTVGYILYSYFEQHGYTRMARVSCWILVSLFATADVLSAIQIYRVN